MELGLRPVDLELLQSKFGDRVQERVPLARYTAARIGGEADFFLEILERKELVEVIQLCWKMGFPYVILGGGSNVLISDKGIRGFVILNRTRQIRFEEEKIPPEVWAESGANLGVVARMAAQRGLGGLEWATGIPGTLGGAVFGNAGAHDDDISKNLIVAEILHRKAIKKEEIPDIEKWTADQLDYEYRSSVLKRNPGTGVILSATLKLESSTPQSVQEKIDELTVYRKRTQPSGASIGSMFKNPPDDHAGRLIEAAGLKGVRVGDAQVSSLHANFFINLGNARAKDVFELIQMAHQTVRDKYRISLELEIELLGEW